MLASATFQIPRANTGTKTGKSPHETMSRCRISFRRSVHCFSNGGKLVHPCVSQTCSERQSARIRAHFNGLMYIASRPLITLSKDSPRWPELCILPVAYGIDIPAAAFQTRNVRPWVASHSFQRPVSTCVTTCKRFCISSVSVITKCIPRDIAAAN